MKAVLVIDMPSSCSMCKTNRICKVWNEEVVKWKGYNDRLDGCPLKPLPRKKNKDFHPNIVYANGWNDCLEAIKGDEE